MISDCIYVQIVFDLVRFEILLSVLDGLHVNRVDTTQRIGGFVLLVHNSQNVSEVCESWIGNVEPNTTPTRYGSGGVIIDST